MASKDDQLPSILGNQVSLTNIAARNAQGFSLREKRLVMAGVSMLDSRQQKNQLLDLSSRTVRVHAYDYAELAQIDERSAYKELIQASDNLFNRYLRYNVITPRGVKERKLRWVEAVQYHHGEGWVEYSFTESILPHLCALKREFTRYRLAQASGLRSIYSWRLLEILTSHNDGNAESKIQVEKISIGQLRESLEIPESYKYKDIRVRVIEPAVKELIQKDHWHIQWRPIKTGRSVTAIEFTFKRDISMDTFKQTTELFHRIFCNTTSGLVLKRFRTS